MQLAVNGAVRNYYEYDSTCYAWILLVKICHCSTNTLAAFKSQLFSSYAAALLRIIHR